MIELDVFISGENIDLCIPTVEFAKNSKWYSWFNSSKVTRFLEQGIFPNSPEKQEEFMLSLGPERLTFIISDKSEYIGVVSLSFIDLVKKTCDIAMVINTEKRNDSRPYIIALESIARMTEHAFDRIGIERISAGQHVKLASWQNRMELLGYKLEGWHKNKFVKGPEVADAVSISCVREDYLAICNRRGGHCGTLQIKCKSD